MDKKEGKAAVVGKTNEKTKAADCFYLALIHVLTVLLGLQLDTCHSRVRDILDTNECCGWSKFNNKSIGKWLKEEYK